MSRAFVCRAWMGAATWRWVAPWPLAARLTAEPASWLVWTGAIANAKPVIRDVGEGRWSRRRFLAYEGIRDELDAYAKRVIAGRLDQARESAIRMLQRPDAQPTRLIALSHAMVLSLQERQDADLARALADRAVRDTGALPTELALLTNEPVPKGLPRWIARPRANTPPECDLSTPKGQP